MKAAGMKWHVLCCAWLCVACSSASAAHSTVASPTKPSVSFVSATPVVVTATPAPARPSFDGMRAYNSVVQQVALGPRITGSEPHRRLGDLILAQLAANGWVTQTQVFTYMHTPARNLVGIRGTGQDIILLGAHYDTRRMADQDKQQPNQPVPGANDGASGVAVLLELSRALEPEKTGKQIWLVFFDAEDNGELNGWDWIAGSRAFAASLTVTPTAVVIVDMVGDQQQDIYRERNSNAAVVNQIWDVAQRLGYGAHFIKQIKWSMTDDHTPFLERGWPAVDIIDFDYPYWHTTQDTPDKISALSLERVGRTLEVWLEGDK